MRMESFGIPCEHIVCVLVHEDIEELPRSLVLPQWTKTAKVDNERFIFTRKMAMNLLKQFKEEDAAQKELINDADSVRDDVQVDASGVGLPTNDLGHSLPRDPRKCRTKGGIRSPIKENIDVDSVAWRATIEQLIVFVVSFHS
ncbi:Protein FAR1-RELATED SEQUENCE [Arachis hypogaea]|nr:Protein FAR1-RELATED SEQUENCE [Arachis hypogaea]